MASPLVSARAGCPKAAFASPRSRHSVQQARPAMLVCQCASTEHSSWPGAKSALALAAAAALALAPLPAWAVSGGGGTGTGVPLAFSDQSGANMTGKKLYKADLRGTNFSNADLSNANLFGAFAKDASFKGAKLTNTDLESVDFENADLSDAVLEGAQVTNAQFRGNVNIKGSDWTDVTLRKDVQKKLCAIADGTNPTTGVDTRESLLC